MLTFAQFERELASERTKNKMLERTKVQAVLKTQEYQNNAFLLSTSFFFMNTFGISQNPQQNQTFLELPECYHITTGKTK